MVISGMQIMHLSRQKVTWSMEMVKVLVWRASMPSTRPMLSSSSTSKRPSRVARIVGACTSVALI